MMKKITLMTYIIFCFLIVSNFLEAKELEDNSRYLFYRNPQRFAVIGDAGHWNIHAEKVRDSILKRGVQNLILPGDNLYDTSLNYDDVWSHWINSDLNFSVTALGNHYKTIPSELSYFGMPSNFYYKDLGSVRFIVLDSETQDVLDQQIALVEDALENSPHQFNVIVFHHPMATISYRHGWRERQDFHLAMRPVFEKYQKKINLVINGHDHLATLFTYNDLPVLVSGAVFESRPAPAFEYQQEGGAFISTKWVNKNGYYWVELEFLPDENLIKLNFIRTDKPEVSCLMYVKNKTIFRHPVCYK